MTHGYVRAFGDSGNSIDSCRNCRTPAPGPDATDEGYERVVHLEDREEAGDREETEPDAAEAEGPVRRPGRDQRFSSADDPLRPC